MEYFVGDKVLWLPSIDHAYNQIVGHGTAWDFEWDQNGKKTSLSSAQASDYLGKKNKDAIKRHLKPVKPNKPWPAVITFIHEDGSADLEIDALPWGGVKHHYARIKYDPTKSTPNTWSLAD